MQWQTPYNKTIQKKVFHLVSKLLAEGASNEEIELQKTNLITKENQKAIERKRKKLEKVSFLLRDANEYITEDEFLGVCVSKNFVINKDNMYMRVGITEKKSLFTNEVVYDWTFPIGLYDFSESFFVNIHNFVVPTIKYSRFCRVLPDTFVMEIEKLTKSGKATNKKYYISLLMAFVLSDINLEII
ncbi:MAG: hypothetical protein EAZ85_14065, partial [Bacteroidetes bacterium]